MHCPFCQASDTKVIDSRLSDEGNQVRRRRECVKCNERFTTYETVELALPRVIKNDGRRAPFNQEKLRSGLLKSLEKRPVSMDEVGAAMNRILHRIQSSGEREISSSWIGKLVMDELREIDEVAYVRFASVYRSFQDVKAFSEEIQRLQNQSKDD